MNSPNLFFPMSGLINATTSILLGLLVITRNRKDPLNITYFLFCASVAFWSIFYALWLFADNAAFALFCTRGLMAGAIFTPIFYLHHLLMLLGIEKENRQIVRASYAAAIVFSVINLTPYFIKGVSAKMFFKYWPDPGVLFNVFLPIWIFIVVFGIIVAVRTYRSSSGIKKTRSRYVLVAILIGWAGGITNYPLWYGIHVPPVGNILVSVYVLLTTYAIIRYRLLDIRIVAARAMVFLLVYIPILAVPFIMASAARVWLEQHFGDLWWVVPMVASTILAPAGLRVYQYIKVRAEKAIRSKKLEYLQEVSDFLEDVKGVRGLDELVSMILSKTSELIKVDYTGLYLWDKKKGVLSLKGAVKSDTRKAVEVEYEIPEDNALIKLLIRERGPLVREELKFESSGGGSALTKEAGTEMNRINASVVIPSFYHENLIAAIALGEQISYEPYENEDIEAFNDLGVNIGMAIKNALFVEDLNKTHAKVLKSQEEEVRQENLISLGYMVTNLSHELRNPMHVISANIEEMQDVLEMDIKADKLDGQTNESVTYLKEKMAKAYERAERTRKMLDSIMDAIREKGREFTDFDLKEMVDEVILRVAPYTKGGSITVINEFPEGFPRIRGDRVMIEQVFVNLISNAVQMFEVSGKGDRVYVRGREDGAVIRVEVSDNGPGIPEYDLERIFEPFYTTKDNLFAYADGKSKGTGLGLMITQQTVRKHGGKIWAQSVEGEGATFVIELPKIV